MQSQHTSIYSKGTPLNTAVRPVEGDYVEFFGETYYKIHNYDQMPPFFMSLVSNANHWLFISSTGGLTAGRVNAESALFPYETDDKIAANSEDTGPKAIFLVSRDNSPQLWEPFSDRYAGIYQCERNLYKNIYGNKLIFEEINHDLGLTYRYAWRTSDRFGFVKSSWLSNQGDPCRVELLDGLQNLLPYGVSTRMQTQLSNLLDAYKRNELESETGLGIFALSATLTDRAEPSESLMASVVWHVGLESPKHLLSSAQIDDFRRGISPLPENDVRGKRGAYLVHSTLDLATDQTQDWHMVADVNYDSRDVTNLVRLLKKEGSAIQNQVEEDIDAGTKKLIEYVANADGLQMTAEQATTAHHFANVMFNIMRGGIFADDYRLDKSDLLDFVRTRNRPVLSAHKAWFASLPDSLTMPELYQRAADTDSADVERLCYEYLPLIFSRRHGDPSRPWNRFSINLKREDGSPRLDYQGNWRDIFQNWEPLLYAFPVYSEGIIAKFLNATTPDGYNPYRVTRDGIEWEIPEPENPWSNIGYWSDHQIIYLQKLLEFAEEAHPGSLQSLWNRPIFAYADVPYRLRPYEQMLTDWYNTIDFDWDSETAIEAALEEIGTDAKLCRTDDGAIIHVTMVEKLLVLLLAKLTNLVPEGGIWMNTQRPEWNDANNALVGKGLSVVTTAYLRRFIAFWQSQLADSDNSFTVNEAVADLFKAVNSIFADHQTHLESGFTDETRRAMMDALGVSATEYRARIYEEGPTAPPAEVSAEALHAFLARAQSYIEETLRANRREDGLYHAYNILSLGANTASIDYLYPMLEGQVAILSAGMLTPEEAASLLKALRQSDLYRANQHSYMLYPNRDLPGFLEKNLVTAEQVADSDLVAALTEANDQRLLVRDEAGNYHFHGTFRNAEDVKRVLNTLAQESAYADLVAAERTFILNLFETVFNHRAFTGRSGTFFAFEGLGSIYWHMVSKLLLAAQEAHTAALNQNSDPDITATLEAAYYDVRAGIGFNKSPDIYGAFPTDPYSHTPADSGARQPGMTGQVKEEVLTRMGELGVSVEQGALHFEPTMLKPGELLTAPAEFNYVNLQGETETLALPADSLAFTYCQTPIIYTFSNETDDETDDETGDKTGIKITFADGRRENVAGNQLSPALSQHLFKRDGQVKTVTVALKKSIFNASK